MASQHLTADLVERLRGAWWRPRSQARQPHFQSRDYNPLNGDVQRWFDAVETDIAEGAILRSVFRFLTPLFAKLDGLETMAAWHSEVHQFRVETSPAEIGRRPRRGFIGTASTGFS